MFKGLEIRVRGLVQGVGFRPFVYRLAKKHNLKGFVLNDAEGVKIQVSGLTGRLESFLSEMKSTPPPLSEITSIESKKILRFNFPDFSIVESQKDKKINTLISPDIATCDDCLKDITDPSNRRYLYPFTNCTNCGPRFTIIERIPYDRPNTTMKNFKMCKGCYQEYNDPLDRRFHAQPIACAKCGPRLKILDKDTKTIRTKDPLGLAIKYLKKGKIVAIKGLGGFHLACDATSKSSVARLREIKGREEKPLAMMVFSSKEAGKISKLSKKEKKILEAPERPIVLLEKEKNTGIAEEVAPSNKYFGIMLPYTPLHHLLFTYDYSKRNLRKNGCNFKALVMTSANISEEPIVINEKEAQKRISGTFDYILTHNREINTRTDDSVVRVEAEKPLFIRRSRGFTPSPIYLEKELREILAVGAELKNTVCITSGHHVFLSQHIGDLKNIENYEFFKESISHLKKTLKIEPKIVSFDMHPNYLSSKYALAENFQTKIAIQHHHAHMASCMAENNLHAPSIGIILDGTGYGIDGTIWGGEILFGDIGNFERKAHLRKVIMPGGDAAANEPYRMAFSYLYSTYGQFWKNLNFDFINRIGRDRLEFLEKMIQSKVNCPFTSSLGRLFDAVSSLLGIKDYNTYEGQAAFELEMAAKFKTKECYPYTLFKEDGNIIINTVPMIEGIVKDLRENKKKMVSTKFHNTIIKALAQAAGKISKEIGVKTIVLSGGCFQNVYLLKGMILDLEKIGMKVYTHKKVPPNDGGISLGQATIANRIANAR